MSEYITHRAGSSPRRQPCNNIVRTRSHHWGASALLIGKHKRSFAVTGSDIFISFVSELQSIFLLNSYVNTLLKIIFIAKLLILKGLFN